MHGGGAGEATIIPFITLYFGGIFRDTCRYMLYMLPISASPSVAFLTRPPKLYRSREVKHSFHIAGDGRVAIATGVSTKRAH